MWLLPRGGWRTGRDRLVAVVLGWSLLDEGERTFAEVVGGEDADRGIDLGRVTRGEVVIERTVHEDLDFADRERSPLGDLLADGAGTGDGLTGRDDLVDEPDPLGLLGRDDPAGQCQLLGPCHPDDPWQALRPPGPGRDREAHFRQPE